LDSVLHWRYSPEWENKTPIQKSVPFLENIQEAIKEGERVLKQRDRENVMEALVKVCRAFSQFQDNFDVKIFAYAANRSSGRSSDAALRKLAHDFMSAAAVFGRTKQGINRSEPGQSVEATNIFLPREPFQTQEKSWQSVSYWEIAGSCVNWGAISAAKHYLETAKQLLPDLARLIRTYK
jgi:hypothetical protein